MSYMHNLYNVQSAIYCPLSTVYCFRCTVLLHTACGRMILRVRRYYERGTHVATVAPTLINTLIPSSLP